MISAPFDLLQETHHFYQLLYSAEPHDEQASTNFLNIQTPTLTTAERTSCEEQLNENELLEALNTMENNKSPDFDGLTTNFYKHFWPLLVPDWHVSIIMPLKPDLSQSHNAMELSP